VVFGAGYIFAYNLPVMSRLGVNLYQTVTLLIIAYSAGVSRPGEQEHGQAALVLDQAEPVPRPQHLGLGRGHRLVGALLAADADDPDPRFGTQAGGRPLAGLRVQGAGLRRGARDE
jgi:hypothetical protein